VRVAANRGEVKENRLLLRVVRLGAGELSGPAVTDSGIRHLAPLRHLRTLMAQPSSITEAGAQALAGRLPAVTIITLDHVVKSPCESITFRRRRAGEWASALVPEDWRTDEDAESIGAREDGWELVAIRRGRVGPAKILLYPREEEKPPTAEAELRKHLRPDHHHPRILEEGVVAWPGWEIASCVYANDRGQHLTYVAVRGNRVVVLDCEAPAARFESFRPLFLFVARSVRLGDAAREGADERTEIPTSELR
jgi:hypothetical protein